MLLREIERSITFSLARALCDANSLTEPEEEGELVLRPLPSASLDRCAFASRCLGTLDMRTWQREERVARKVGEGRGRSRKRRRGERRSARGARRKKKQKKGGTHPRGRPNGRAGHCTRLCECNSLQLHCERRAKTSTTDVCTGAMPYLGVTLPAALTYPRRYASSFLLSSRSSSSTSFESLNSLAKGPVENTKWQSLAIIAYEDVRGCT